VRNFIPRSKGKGLRTRPATGVGEDGKTYTKLNTVKAGDPVFTSFRVTTDSVVAKAVAVVPGLRRLDVYWGDGTKDTITRLPGSHAEPPPYLEAPLPEGTYEFFHQYKDGPSSGAPFTHTVRASAVKWGGGSDLQYADVIVTPLYRVNLYPTYITFTGPCDPPWSTDAYFEIYQTAGDRTRKWTTIWVNSGGAPYWRLEGSEYTTRISASDSTWVHIQVWEIDDWNMDDWLSYGSPSITSQTQDGWIEGTHAIAFPELPWDTCGFRVKFYVSVKLSVPIPQQSGPVFYAAGNTRSSRATRKKG
jgi:hypothetical protein